MTLRNLLFFGFCLFLSQMCCDIRNCEEFWSLGFWHLHFIDFGEFWGPGAWGFELAESCGYCFLF